MHELVIVVFYFYMVRIGHSVSTSISHMVRNGHSVILFPNWLLSNITYGTKWLWCKIHMVRNCNFVVRNGKLWYEMVMVQNSYGTKWFLVMVRNCNFVVRNGKLWYEMAMVRNGYGTKWLASLNPIYICRLRGLEFFSSQFIRFHDLIYTMFHIEKR
jgi:hypothetical protein